MNEINLKAEYFPETDMLTILLPGGEYEAGHQAGDPDVVLHHDIEGRLVEIEIENASKRVSPDVLEAAKQPAQ